jgi:ribosomal protein S18 acetylase RimI-like enzyme
MKIELMKEIDILSCATILQRAYEQAPYKEMFEGGIAEEHIKAKYVLSAENSFIALNDDGKIVGFILISADVWISGKQAVIEEFAVHPTFQNQGIGRSLIEYSKKYLKDKGFTSVMLWATKDKKLIEFYNQQGFSVSEN